jgi:SAM-dependent methyltransferase
VKSPVVGNNRFWSPLWRWYADAPSIAFCRIPELEYASSLDVKGTVLDHCCGDGRFASLAWPGQKFHAGCDISSNAVNSAARLGIYSLLDVCDVSQKLPYDDCAFDLVFNNSALEHIRDLEAALAEVARVLVPGGMLAFNVLNHRYFEWWPLDEASMAGYREWQPFFHALSLDDWTQKLAAVGLKVASVEGYFDRQAARMLARLDCAFSGVYIANRPSVLVSWYRRAPRIMHRYWCWRLSSFTWKTGPDQGAGYFIKAVRSDG